MVKRKFKPATHGSPRRVTPTETEVMFGCNPLNGSAGLLPYKVKAWGILRTPFAIPYGCANPSKCNKFTSA